MSDPALYNPQLVLHISIISLSVISVCIEESREYSRSTKLIESHELMLTYHNLTLKLVYFYNVHLHAAIVNGTHGHLQLSHEVGE